MILFTLDSLHITVTENSTEPTIAIQTQSEGQPSPDHDQTKTIIASTITSVVLVIITITVVAVAVYAAGRRYGGSKLVLQVTGDSMDIINGDKLPSVTIQRYVCVIMT